MNLIEQWNAEKRLIQSAVVQGWMSSTAADILIKRLDARIARRPLILKRRRDRNKHLKQQDLNLINRVAVVHGGQQASR